MRSRPTQDCAYSPGGLGASALIGALSVRPARTDRRSRSRTPRSASPAKACATKAGTWAFIAQVSDRSPSAPNLRPAMKTMFWTFRQRLDGGFIEQIAIDGLDAAGLAATSCTLGVAEARDADDAAIGQGGLGEAGERRSHLAGDAEDHDVAVDLSRDRRSAPGSAGTTDRRALRCRKSCPADCRASAACFFLIDSIAAARP